MLANEPDAWKTLNLSEKHLAFFANVWLNDPDSSQYGEGIYSVNGEDFTHLAAEDIYAGGTAFLAAHTFAAGIGPVREIRDELYEYKGENGKIQEGAKVITVKGKNRKAYTVKGLRKGKRYYITVRPYKTKGGKRYIGIRSKIKAVKVR